MTASWDGGDSGAQCAAAATLLAAIVPCGRLSRVFRWLFGVSHAALPRWPFDATVEELAHSKIEQVDAVVMSLWPEFCWLTTRCLAETSK